MDTLLSTVVEDIQNCLDALLAETQRLIEQEQPSSRPIVITRRKRCHGRRKRRRLEKKCHRRQMTAEETARVLEEYDRSHDRTNQMVPVEGTDEVLEATANENMGITAAAATTTTKKPTKRKRSNPPSLAKKKIRTREQQQQQQQVYKQPRPVSTLLKGLIRWLVHIHYNPKAITKTECSTLILNKREPVAACLIFSHTS